MEVTLYLQLPSPKETHSVIKIGNWKISRRSSVEVRDRVASVHGRVCIVMPWFYIQRHKTPLKQDKRHKWFRFQPWPLTEETLWINTSLKRALQKRKRALYSSIRLTGSLQCLHRSTDSEAHAQTQAQSILMWPYPSTLPLATSPIPGGYPCASSLASRMLALLFLVFFSSHGQKAEQSRHSLLLPPESVKWLMPLPPGFLPRAHCFSKNTTWSHLGHHR